MQGVWEGRGHAGSAVSWEEQLFSLFDDLEQQAEALYDAERDADLADRSRAEYAAVTLASRLMASLDRELSLEVRGVGRIDGVLRRVAEGWCLLHGSGQDWVVRTAAISVVRGPSERSVPEVAWSPVTKLGLGSALRRIADSGERCRVHLVDGACHDVVLTRVGKDFVEARAETGQSVLVSFDAMAAVQSRR